MPKSPVFDCRESRVENRECGMALMEAVRVESSENGCKRNHSSRVSCTTYLVEAMLRNAKEGRDTRSRYG